MATDGEDLRAKGRALDKDPQDPWTKYRFRKECVRRGCPEAAGYEIGDIVRVEEVYSPYIKEPWIGQLKRLFGSGKEVIHFSLEQNSVKGTDVFYLIDEDKITLLEPVLPEDYRPF